MGEGEYWYPEGGSECVYRGQFYGGLRDGEGELEFVDGSQFRGTFDNGHITGKGEYIFPDEDWSYAGEFYRNKPRGDGELMYPDGSTFKGPINLRDKDDITGAVRFTDAGKFTPA